jgi:hypothetical protein
MNTSQINETFQLRGHTRIWKNDELIFDKDNAIVPGEGAILSAGAPTGLKAYLAQCMYPGTVVNTASALVDAAIDDEFTTSDVTAANYDLATNAAIDALFDNKDGIIIAATDAPLVDCFAMVTTNVAKTQTYGRKWKGVFTATGARAFSIACIGHGLISDSNSGPVSGITEMFDTPYANQSFTTVTLASADTLTIEWEVYIA